MNPRLGDILVSWGVITDSQLNHCLSLQSKETNGSRRRLGRILLDEGLATEITLAAALAQAYGLNALDLSTQEVDNKAAHLLPQSVAQRTGVLPIGIEGKTVHLAVSDPVDVVGIDDVRMTLRQLLGDVEIHVAVAPESQIQRKLAATWNEANTAEALSIFDVHGGDTASEESENDEGAITAVRQILTAAVQLGATDVHVEPLPNEVRIRMRVDGALRRVMSLPRSGQAPLTSRIKIMANLDIARKRVPQDGRAHTVINGLSYNMRVSTLPTLRGEKVVIRLLTDVGELPTLSTLGLPKAQLQMLNRTLRSPQGLVLITGPTGSGKTTTLYSAINEIVTGDRNLITLEEPVEIELPGVSQVQIDEKAGMTFAAGLRSVLRQDPDIIMVGEIRDQTTAELAIRAALTGHLVLATVHTNDAASAVVRLIDMGVPRYLIASALTLVIAQRLVRKPCPNCVVPDTADRDTRARLRLTDRQAQAMMRGTGCEKCEGRGFRGRTGVYEMLPFAPEVRKALLAGGDENALTSAARAYGWRPLVESGIDVACAGRTSLSEVLRVLVTEHG